MVSLKRFNTKLTGFVGKLAQLWFHLGGLKNCELCESCQEIHSLNNLFVDCYSCGNFDH